MALLSAVLCVSVLFMFSQILCIMCELHASDQGTHGDYLLEFCRFSRAIDLRKLDVVRSIVFLVSVDCWQRSRSNNFLVGKEDNQHFFIGDYPEQKTSAWKLLK